jgi:hypothetical protein
MANIWNTLAIIAAILGFLALLGAWFVNAGQNNANAVLGGFTRDNLYWTAIALFVLAIVLWVGSAANAGLHALPAFQ